MRAALFAVIAAAAVCAAAPADRSLGLLLIADWGGQANSPYTEPVQLACAKGMNLIAPTIKAQGAFALGDNFYSAGIDGDAHSKRFKETFEDVYTGSNLDIPFYLVAGNHDHKGNVSAQIAYSQLSPRWTFPDYYYKKTFSWTAGQKTVSADVLFIDTVLLAGNSDDLVEEFGELEGPADQKLAETQWAWIEENLKASTADYLFVAGHYPIWSGCSHGPTPLLVSVLKPMMLKYNATGYLSGHDHCLEHIDDGSGLIYSVFGANVNCCYDNNNVDKCPKGSIKFAMWNEGSPGGFASLVSAEDSLTLTYYAANGTSLYTAPPIKPRK